MEILTRQNISWALLIKRKFGSNRTLSREVWPDFVFAFHDGEEIGPRMLARVRNPAAGKSVGRQFLVSGESGEIPASKQRAAST